MDDSQREQMLMLARGVLPELPCTVQVLSEDGGSFDLLVETEADGLLHAYAPRDRIREGLRVLGRIVDATRGRYEVELEVVESFWHSQTEVLAHLGVNSVQHQKMRRASPRVNVGADAMLRVLFSRTQPNGSELEVKLADVSSTGAAFNSPKPVDPGDMIAIQATLNGHEMSFEARVIRCDLAPWGRFRVGCQLTTVDAADRELIARMADEAPKGSAEQRKPEVVEARKRLLG
jgi:PilZ domain